MHQHPAPASGPDDEADLLQRVESLFRDDALVSLADTRVLAARLQNLVRDIVEHFEHAGSITDLDLVEQLLAGHQSVLDRCDDIDGLVRDAFRRGVDAWLELAVALRLDHPEARHWASSVRLFFENNPAGIFDQIITHSRGLLNSDELRQLAWRYEGEARQSVRGQPANEVKTCDVRACLGLRSVGIALSDISLVEKSVTLASPVPTTTQLADIVQLAINFDELARAEYWLGNSLWRQDPIRKQALEQALRTRSGEGAAVKSALLESFFHEPGEHTLREYLQVANPQDLAAVKGKLLTLAEQHDEACESIDMLIALHDYHRAAEQLVANEMEVSTTMPNSLLKWAQVFEADSQYLAAILCYRMTIRHLLRRKSEESWSHILDYLKRLQALDRFNPDYRHFRDCHDFVEWLEQQANQLKSSQQ